MKAPVYVLGLVAVLLVLAAVAPSLIALSRALLPLIVVLVVGTGLLRLVFFHTRKW